NTDDLFVGKTLLHGDVLMWLMKTLLTSGCTNQRGAGQSKLTPYMRFAHAGSHNFYRMSLMGRFYSDAQDLPGYLTSNSL
ncbi:hypothetical protein, partial [Citrobacter portucalensis]|uniref:hypothetical protein n=1 Tax=Citrobacter portucalensis TaxID=1639133 RepID=UPI001C700AA1